MTNTLRVVSSAMLNVVEFRFIASPTIGIILANLGNPILLCMLGSHLFFNLREAAERGVNVGTNWSSYSHSAIYFEGPHNGNR